MMDDFSYDPMSEEQAMQERFSLLKDGDYDASVEKFDGKISAKGNRTVEFTLNVYDNDGKVHQIVDWITFTPKMTWKLRHHCVSGGMEKEFDNKTWRPQMSVGKLFRVKVVIDQGKEIPADKLKGKPPGSRYPDKNAIEDYIVSPQKSAGQALPKEFDDGIPF